MTKCKYCKNDFKSPQAVKTHQKTAKYCLEKQASACRCPYCQKVLTTPQRLSIHFNTCKKKKKLEDEMPSIIAAARSLTPVNDPPVAAAGVSDCISQQKIDIAVDSPFCQEPLYELEWMDAAADAASTPLTIEEIDEKTEANALPVGDETIEYRDEDGYVNVTNLCKAGKKQFKHWNCLQKTKAFLEALSASVGITTAKLVKIGGTAGDKHTWVHPQVAVNIAQWISPEFDVRISAWIYEMMMTGTVNITSTKTYLELQAENAGNEKRVKYLERKYLKRQPRVIYPEQNVIYILTTPSLKNDRRYILGKAINLTNRLSTYNKTDEHEVVYYLSCPDETKMSLAEPMIFSKLEEYREQANRERFVLPEDAQISLFIDTVKECIEFIG
jgi:hypothetical protein